MGTYLNRLAAGILRAEGEARGPRFNLISFPGEAQRWILVQPSSASRVVVESLEPGCANRLRVWAQAAVEVSVNNLYLYNEKTVHCLRV